MALIVEDGTGKADAESYISAADASAYHAARGNAAWAALTDDTAREQYLRKATEHMLRVYRARWAGVRVTGTQALDWPRSGACVDGYAVAADVVPQDIARACAELALRASSADLAPDLSQAVLREKIGPLETEYSPHSPQQARYQAVDAMLAPYLAAGGQTKIVRA